ncbi:MULTISPECIES: DUF2922 domain-containing protein [Mesobacillus]|uniref:DUF2922 domain-containing protein n=2 Tax=Mesobacillus TaxID=2675231 RepID=A0A0D6Z8S9_9BACI|nr:MULTISPECIES: DUF2922 domain-containing protein [Mesobacillus]KIY20988.1 hypothetical protein UB32_16195 [Mesobacillus subterraneus]MDQ0415438.1 hypothetical protein [Mesobacillus stamsii]
MAKTLELQFATDLGKFAKLTVDNPVEPIDPAAVKLAMEQIIASNAFRPTTGVLVAVDSARVVERNVTDYQLI